MFSRKNRGKLCLTPLIFLLIIPLVIVLNACSSSIPVEEGKKAVGNLISETSKNAAKIIEFIPKLEPTIKSDSSLMGYEGYVKFIDDGRFLSTPLYEVRTLNPGDEVKNSTLRLNGELFKETFSRGQVLIIQGVVLFRRTLLGWKVEMLLTDIVGVSIPPAPAIEPVK